LINKPHEWNAYDTCNGCGITKEGYYMDPLLMWCDSTPTWKVVNSTPIKCECGADVTYGKGNNLHSATMPCPLYKKV